MPAGRAVVAPVVRGSGAALRPRRSLESWLLGARRSLSVVSSPVSRTGFHHNDDSTPADSLSSLLRDRARRYMPSRMSPLLVRFGEPESMHHRSTAAGRNKKIAMRRWSSTSDLSKTAASTTAARSSSTGSENKALAPKASTPAPTHTGHGRSSSSGLRRPKAHQTNFRPSFAPLFRLPSVPEADASTMEGVSGPSVEDRMDHVLESVALECDLVLSQYRQASKATRDEVLWATMGCLLDVSRRPGLREALTSHGIGAPQQQPTSKLRIHRAFLTLLSAATDVVVNRGVEGDDSDQVPEEDNSSVQQIEQVMQLARQAHRLDLPLPLPLYQKLAQMSLSANSVDDESDVSFVAIAEATSSSHLSAAATMLLEIADWQASEGGVAHQSTAVSSIDIWDESTDLADSVAARQDSGRKLRLLVPSLQRLIERRRYGVVLETISALLIRGGNEERHEPSRVADFDTLFALMMAAREGVVSSPANVMEIRQILELLEPSVGEMIRSNKELLQAHPHVRNFLHRYFFADVDDEFDDDEDGGRVDDPYEVWDPMVADLLKPRDGSSNIPDATLQDRVAAVSDFYAAMDAAVDAKLIQISQVQQFPTFVSEVVAAAVDASSSSSSDDDNDDEEGNDDDDDDSEWSSDSDAESEDGMTRWKIRGDGVTNVTMLRHHLYVRGRGKALDAGYLPDVTAQAIHLHNGLNVRYTEEYENWLWKRDFQDDDNDDDDDDLSLLTLHGDSDDDPFDSGDDDDDDDDDDNHSR